MTQELYELPEGWEWKSIENVFSITSGKNLTTKIIQDNTGEYPVYGGNGITGFYKDFNLDGENIIIGRVGALCGNVRNVEEKIWVTDNAFYINNYKINIDKKFLVLLLGHLDLGSYANRAAQPVISYKSIKNILIPIPEHKEQQCLVRKLDSLLSRIDTAIEHLEHSLELNDQLFASSLNQAFNPLNAEVQSDGTYQLPEGWEWKLLSEVCDMEKTTISPDAKKQYFYVGLEHIESNTGKIDADEVTQGASILSTKVQFSENDVLYGKLRPYLNKVGIAEQEGISSTEIIPLTCTPEISAQYLSSFLRTPFFVNWAVNNCSGARMPRVTTKFVKQVAKVPLCSKEQQKEISDLLENLSYKTQANKQALQQKLEQLQQLRASLLDSAFRGEL